MLGRIQPAYFPAVFGASGSEPADAAIVRERFAALARRDRRGDREPGRSPPPSRSPPGSWRSRWPTWRTRSRRSRSSAATTSPGTCWRRSAGRAASTRARSPTRWASPRCSIHPLAGVLSAYGMGLADVTAMRERSVEAPLSAGLLPELGRVADDLAADALAPNSWRRGRARRAQSAAVAAGPPALRGHRHRATGRRWATPPRWLADFEQAYRQHFSFLMRDKPIIAEAVSVELAAPPAPRPHRLADRRGRAAAAAAAGSGGWRRATVLLYSGGGWTRAPLAPAAGPAARRAGRRARR